MTTVQMLARYLRAHPNVCDTAEGIAHWWLMDMAPPAVVEAALGWMLERGVIETLSAADGRRRVRRIAGPGLDERLAAIADDPAGVGPLQPAPGSRSFH